ncbi:DNA repair and recombination protein radA [Nitzschia inconspicua]|uniref:DNA repair protein RAD51 homolog 3 n=1 Tax=Nitzschia inconspicua TaxID=303405 RepID=A0A9K3LH49_9STRA|nr:DNA repair and recombination protein radA [Nitzschia inconspicua]
MASSFPYNNNSSNNSNPSSNNNNTPRCCGRLSIPLSELPLRPSTLQLFAKRGFETVSELDESKSHGMANLAAELDVPLEEAAGFIREVQGCFQKHPAVVVSPIDNSVAAVTTNYSIYNNDSSSIIIDNGGTENTSNHGHTSNKALSNSVAQHNHLQQQQHEEEQLPQQVDDYCSLGIKTAYDLLNDKSTDGEYGPSCNSSIVTFCRAMDELLGGGITLGQVTEIAGMPGTGKTQMAIQLAVLARLIPDLGGVQGQTLYVDCEGSFLPERAWQMAKAVSEHARHNAYRKTRKENNNNTRRRSSSGNGSSSTTATTSTNPTNNNDNGRDNNTHWNDLVYRASLLTPEEILSSIHVYRVHDETALLATLFTLKDFVQEQSQGELPVRLIVIDSIAFHFRAVTPTDAQYYIQRAKTLTQLAAYLGDLASHYNLAVVAINQMTTKIVQTKGGNSSNSSNTLSTNVPALGESWAHATTTRLLLKMKEFLVAETTTATTPEDENDDHHTPSKQDIYPPQLRQDRTCTLIKSPNRPPGTVPFRITKDGIRDIAKKDQTRSSSSEGILQEHGSQKRHRTG